MPGAHNLNGVTSHSAFHTRVALDLASDANALNPEGTLDLIAPAEDRAVAGYVCRNYIIQSDLEHFLSEEHAVRAMKMLDGDGDGKVRADPLHLFQYQLGSWK